jgi:hypothetical protein
MGDATTPNSGTPFVRREAWALESDSAFDPITLAYADAVQVMQARPPADPTSWSYQGAIHAAFAPAPAGASWNQCQHRGWFFLPWHRMYLYYFERIVRAAVLAADGPADFAIPYWNYDSPFPGNTLPPAFRTPALPDGSPNALFVAPPGRARGLMNGGQISPLVTSSSAAMAMTSFTSPASGFGGGKEGPLHFGASLGQLESTPHNDMHPTIGGAAAGQCQGGLMTDPRCAALDPIFWLHHANIDRLWNNWLASGDGRVNPQEEAWLTQTFTFADETGAEVSMSVDQVVDSADQLQYIYDDVDL